MPAAFWVICATAPLSFAVAVLAARGIIGIAWGRLARAFPARPVVEPSHRRRFQSCTVGGWCNVSGCLTIAVDEGHLHFITPGFARLFGATALSIPWGAIEAVEPLRRRGWSRARLAGTTVDVPAWCLEPAGAGRGA